MPPLLPRNSGTSIILDKMLEKNNTSEVKCYLLIDRMVSAM